MKKFNLKEKFLKITLAAVTAGILLGAVFALPMNIDAATDPSGVVATTNRKVLLADKLLSAEGINDPTAVSVSGKGTYQKPSDYIYYGVDGAGNPLLWRVLDSDADNAGNSGAMFLFSEQIVDSNEIWSAASDNEIYHYYDYYMDFNERFPDAEPYDIADVAGGRFEFTYQGSYMESYEYALRRFVNRNHYEDYFWDPFFLKNLSLDVHELSAILPVTKKDSLPVKDFGLNDEYNFWTVDTIYGSDGTTYAGNVLENNYIFPLSIEEVEKYVADYNGAPGMSAYTATGQQYSGWWLRTAYSSSGYTGESSSGNVRMNILAGTVDRNGNVSVNDVDDRTVGGRYGINLDLGRITYAEAVESNVWRFGLIEPFYYNNPDKQFDAWVTDLKDGILTVGYKNAIGRYQPNYRDADEQEEFISVMIKDKNGNVKYYGTVDLAPNTDGYNKLVEDEGEANFAIPEGIDFNEREGDRMLVFWERKSDDSRKTSFTSNIVELECTHSDYEPHSCISNALCNICGESFGEIDPDDHLRTEFFKGTADEKAHGYKCVTEGCPMNGLAIFSESCVVLSNCTTVFEPCSCGNEFFDDKAHKFEDSEDPEYVVTGFCEYNDRHYQPASLNKNGEYVIDNVGKLFWLAEQVNAGKMVGDVKVTVEMESIDLSEYIFVPIGTAEHPFAGSFDGKNVTVNKLAVTGFGFGGLFGYTDGAVIENIIFDQADIEGDADLGVVVGNAKNTRISNCAVMFSYVSGNGNVGGIVGSGDQSAIIESCLVYDSYDGDGEYLPLSGNELPTVINSFYLADEIDLRGGRTEEQMESGEVAYYLGDCWGQWIGKNKYPTIGNSVKVNTTKSCDGTHEIFTNEDIEQAAHTFGRFVEFIWDGTLCDIRVGCVKCGYSTVIKFNFGEYDIIDNGAGVSYTYTAYFVDSEGERHEESKTFIVKTIEGVTAVEKVVKDFDGEYVYADDLMSNTKMNYLGFHTRSDAFAYFVDSVTGEYLGNYVGAAGVYDLVVDGMNNYEGQKYIYKEIVIINKISLTLEVTVLPKAFDGTSKMEFDYRFLEDVKFGYDWLRINVADPDGVDFGEYTVAVELRFNRGTTNYPVNPDYLDDPYTNQNYDYDRPFYAYDMYKDSIELKWNETAVATILPQRQVNIEVDGLWADNFIIEYPDDPGKYEFTYGDNIPDPKEADFSFDKGSKLSFEWYRKKYIDSWDYELVKLSGKPSDAGEYILRVVAASTENLVKSYIDVEFTILPKTLKVEFIIPDDAEYIDYYGEKYYIFEAGSYPEFTVGIDESQWEEYGISFDGWARTEIENDYEHYSGYPTVPGRYWVNAYVNIASVVNGAANYVIESNGSIKIMLKAPESAFPLDADHIFDGEVKEIEVIAPEGWTDEDYTIEITDGEGNAVPEIREAGIYSVSVTDKNGVTNTSTVTVRREIKIFVKETFAVISEFEGIEFDLMDLTFEAGYAPIIGHTITDLEYYIDAEHGEITVSGWTIMEGDKDVSYLYTVNTTVYAWRHENGGSNVIHIFDDACDGECNVSGCEYTRFVRGHRGGVATCSSQAVCDTCGSFYGELDSERHDGEKQIYVPGATDLMTHDLVYACCGKLISTEAHHVDVAATCTDIAVCKVCSADGFSFGDLDPENHASEEIRYTLNAEDAGKHDSYHACCDVFVESAEHTGGVADCVNLKVCEVCENSYGELDPDNHTDIENHTKATCKTLAKCSACEAEYGELDPENHESDGFAHIPDLSDGKVHEIYRSCCDLFVGTEEHSGGEATCNAKAVCDVCRGEYGALDPDNHTSDELSYSRHDHDGGLHYVYRSCCGAEPVTEAHSGGSATCEKRAECEKCGVEYGEMAEHIYDNACDTVCNVCEEPTRGMVFHKDEDGDEKCDLCQADVESSEIGAVDEEGGLPGRAVSAIAVASVATVGTGGFSLFWFVIKKKSWAELLGLLIG